MKTSSYGDTNPHQEVRFPCLRVYSSCQQSSHVLDWCVTDNSTTGTCLRLWPYQGCSSGAATIAVEVWKLGKLDSIKLALLRSIKHGLIFVKRIASHCSPGTPEQWCVLLPSRAIRSVIGSWMMPPKVPEWRSLSPHSTCTKSTGYM